MSYVLHQMCTRSSEHYVLHIRLTCVDALAAPVTSNISQTLGNFPNLFHIHVFSTAYMYESLARMFHCKSFASQH